MEGGHGGGSVCLGAKGGRFLARGHPQPRRPPQRARRAGCLCRRTGLNRREPAGRAAPQPRRGETPQETQKIRVRNGQNG